MIRRNILSLKHKWLFFIAVAMCFAGCLSDPNQPFQVRPELVLAPPSLHFQAPVTGYVQFSAPPAGSMLVTWNRSIADTQLNFKGYFVKLYTSDTSGIIAGSTENIDSLVDTVSIFRPAGMRTDTFYQFNTVRLPSIHLSTAGVPIPLHRYTVVVHGLKTGTADTTIYSTDSAVYSALFDPLPMENPTNLRATSVGPTQVALRWTDPVTAHDTGFLQYIVYYRDTTKFQDTGHICGQIPKWGTLGNGNDSTITVSVPPSNVSGSTTTEYRYEFWVKSERNDSTFSFGPDIYGTDTNHITWAGAELIPKSGNDSESYNSGCLLVPGSRSVYLGPSNSQYDMLIDSVNSNGQIVVDTANGVVTLKVQATGMGFMNRIDPARDLDSLFYSVPLADPTQFTQTSITLPATGNDSTGVVVYLRMTDDVQPSLGNQYARIYIRAQLSNGSFINTEGTISGVDMKASFQPGVTKDGSQHLPYY